MNFGDINILDEFAEVLNSKPKGYLTILAHELSTGVSYPKARENALLMYLNDIRKYANIMSGSNNILAIEYLKAIKKLKSNILPVTIKRQGTDYNSLEEKDGFASATAIRKMVQEKRNIQKLLPKDSYDILLERDKYGKLVYDISVFEKEIIYILRRMSLKEIANLADVSEGLENKIKSAVNSCNNLEDLISLIKSKRYTQTRIQRVLLYALLNITKKDIENSYKITPYARVLGVNQKGKILLSQLNTLNPKLQVITSVKKFLDEKNNNKILKSMLNIDILASNIYTLGYEYDSKANLDYTEKIITIK